MVLKNILEKIKDSIVENIDPLKNISSSNIFLSGYKNPAKGFFNFFGNVPINPFGVKKPFNSLPISISKYGGVRLNPGMDVWQNYIQRRAPFLVNTNILSYIKDKVMQYALSVSHIKNVDKKTKQAFINDLNFNISLAKKQLPFLYKGINNLKASVDIALNKNSGADIYSGLMDVLRLFD